MPIPHASSSAILVMLHALVNSIPKAAKTCYTDRHNSVIASKRSTLEGGERCQHHARLHASPPRSRSVQKMVYDTFVFRVLLRTTFGE